MQINIPIAQDLLIASGRSEEELGRELQLLLAVKLFELRRLSVGKAAELAGLPKLIFMEELARMGVPLINLDDEQILEEIPASGSR